jgi:hypothetical protein
MPSTLVFEVQRAEKYVRVNFLLRLLFGLYFILYIGHVLFVTGYRTAALLIAGINWILGLITGKNQEGLIVYLRNFLRFDAQLSMSMLGLAEPIPHIDVNTESVGFPATLTVQAESEEAARGYCILRLTGVILLMLIPHFLCLALLRVGMVLAYLVGFFVVLFTGSWPAGIFNFIVGVYRWQYRILEYWFGFTDTYPPFKLA